jgi:beta-lactamase regulating signal transducer with metallopeptidase domain
MIAILKTFWEISLMASVMIGVVLIFRQILAKRTRPVVMLILWGLVLLRLLLPVTLASPLSIADLVPRQNQATLPTEHASELPVQTADVTAIENHYPGSVISNTANNLIYETDPAVVPDSQAAFLMKDLLSNMPWLSLLTTLWIVGVGAILYCARRKTMKFRKQLALCKPIVDAKLLATLDLYKRSIGVGKDITPLECDSVHAPSIFGYFKPYLLIPKRFIKEMDRDDLNSILLHELYHVRCHDVLKNYLWLAAISLHWFNPLVWLAYRKFKDDVELSRDHQVVVHCSQDAVYTYSHSLIQAARFAKSSKGFVPSAIASLFANNCKLRVRISRLVQPYRKNKSSIVITVMLILIMVVSCFTTACQPTPTKEPVIGRQDDILDNITTNTTTPGATTSVSQQPSGTTVPTQKDIMENISPADFKKIEVPDHVSEVHDEFPFLKISFNADVVVPDVTAYPVTIMARKPFTNEKILDFVKICAGSNNELYATWELSRDDYLDKLTKAKKYQGTERVTKEIIDHLDEVFRKAPATVENQPVADIADLIFREHIRGNVKIGDVIGSFSGGREPDTNYFAYSRNIATVFYGASQVADNMYEKNMDGPIEHFKWLQPGKPAISQADAYSIAKNYKDALGIDLDLNFAEPCSFITDYVEKTTGWEFIFTRQASGLKTLTTNDGFFMKAEAAPSYASPWGPEMCIIAIDKDGLAGLTWKGASSITRTFAASVPLADFDSIHQRITDQLHYIYATMGKDQNKTFEIQIVRIELGISMLSLKDEPDAGVYIPTWYVTFARGFAGDNKLGSDYQQIMFSAIDGSYVEPRTTNEGLMSMMGIGPPPDSEVIGPH